MKRLYSIFTFALFCAFLTSCSSDNDTPSQPDDNNAPEGIVTIVPPSGVFAADDGAAKPNDNLSRNVADYLTKAGPQAIKGLGSVGITDEQYNEIKVFTDDLIKEAKSDKDKYDQIFKWIVDNINYVHEGYVDNNPYPVFKERKAVCQGYANLLTVMLHSQGIAVVNTNGELFNDMGYIIGGHAWNYVYLEQWYVSDPTNGGSFLMSDFNKYRHLVPWSLDMDLFEDDSFVFNYQEKHLNLRQVKQSGNQLTVPFSTNGFRVTSFNPNTELPSNVVELYIGKNIHSLGESIIGLNQYAPNVKYAYVDNKNAKITSYGQVVYRYQQTEPVYVPAAATTIQLKGFGTLGKNVLTNHAKLETLVISSGTQTLEAYAIENCPNLKKAYVPKKAKVDSNAFYGVHPDFQIIRQDIEE